MKYGAVKYAILAANAEHPDWTAGQIAEHIGCTAKDVHTAKSRYRLVIPLENLSACQATIRKTRNAEAMRRLFKAEAGRAGDACIEAAFMVLAAGPEDMLDRVFRSVKV